MVAGTTHAPRLYMSVSNPNIPAIRWIDRAAWLPSRYQVTVTHGSALRLRPLTNASAGVITWSQTNASQATLYWDPVVVAGAPSSGSSFWANNTQLAVGVTYKVFVAPRGGFVASAQYATNTSFNWVGVVTGTACGLERWSSIVGANGTTVSLVNGAASTGVVTATTTSSNGAGRLAAVLDNLTWGMTYEVNVVAYCSEVCLRANAAAYGIPVPATGMSPVNVPYAASAGVFVIAPSPAPVVVPVTAPDAVTGVLVPVGIVFGLIGIAAVCFLNGKAGKKKQAAAAAAAVAAAGGAAGKSAARGAPVDPILIGFGGPTPEDAAIAASDALDAHPLNRPRLPALRRALSPVPVAMVGSASVAPIISTGGGAGVAPGEPSPVALLSHFGEASWAMTLVGPEEAPAAAAAPPVDVNSFGTSIGGGGSGAATEAAPAASEWEFSDSAAASSSTAASTTNGVPPTAVVVAPAASASSSSTGGAAAGGAGDEFATSWP